MNTTKLPRRVNPIIGVSLASSRIMNVHLKRCYKRSAKFVCNLLV